MSTVNLEDLPDVDSAQLVNTTPGNIVAQTTFLPCVSDGVTKKIKLSDLSSYRSAGTVKAIYPGSSMSVTTNVQLGVSYASFTLPGAVFAYVGATPPDGWLFCDGSKLSRATYSSLWSVIGTTYGSASGSTFSLPDLRGRAPIGCETMGSVSSSGRLLNTNTGNFSGLIIGSSGGSETHTLLTSETPLPAHTHGFTASTTVSARRQYVDARSQAASTDTLGGVGIVDRPMSITISSAPTDSSASAHTNLPPLAFLNYIIRY